MHFGSPVAMAPCREIGPLPVVCVCIVCVCLVTLSMDALPPDHGASKFYGIVLMW